MDILLSLWKQLSSQYPEFLFGYRDMEGMCYRLSIFDRRNRRVESDVAEIGLEPQAYADIYKAMLKKLLA